jgi:putative ABC transport system permease protein
MSASDDPITGNSATRALATLRLAARLAVRDVRGGIGGMRIVLACLALGVAAIGAVGGLQGMIRDGIASQQRSLLGGDLSIESSDPFPGDLVPFVTAQGARVSEVLRMRSMLYAPHTYAQKDGQPDGRMLVELQAVDEAYPLAGTLTTAPAAPTAPTAPLGDMFTPHAGPPALLADPLVLDRLGLASGAIVRIGSSRFRMAGALIHAPDSAGTVTLAPTVMIARPALDEAGLLQPGALVNRALRIALNGPDQGRTTRAETLARGIAARFPDQGWRIRTVADAAPALTTTIDQVARFLRLIGLTALLLGGLGVSAGVASWLDGRVRTIAILRCLGAPGALVSLTFGLQIAGLCGVGIGGGMVVALLLPPLAIHALAGLLPLAATLAPPVRPALLAGLFGALVACLSTILPLIRASAIPPTALFHDQGRQRTLGPAGRLRGGLAIATCAILLGVLAGLLGPDRLFVAGFLATALAAGAVLALAGGALRRAAASILPRLGTDRGVLRLGLALFARPGAPTAHLVVALGAGLAGMATITLIEGAIMAQLRDQMPHNAPAFYFIDIQPTDLERFDTLARAQPPVRTIQQVPSMRTRIVAVNGVAAEQVTATPQTRWALRGDHGLTVSATPPPGTQLAEGTWWPVKRARRFGTAGHEEWNPFFRGAERSLKGHSGPV